MRQNTEFRDEPDLARVLDVGSRIGPDDMELIDPPAALWNRIALELEPADAASRADLTVLEETGAPTVVVPLERRSRHTSARVLAAAAVIAVVGAAAGAVAIGRQAPAQELVASVDLEVLAGDATGDAELVRVDGEDRLVIDTEGMAPAPDGQHYEVWLIDPEVSDPQSLGTMDGSVEVAVPDSIDPAEYPIVDVSLQDDGQIQHSGNSLLRGNLF